MIPSAELPSQVQVLPHTRTSSDMFFAHVSAYALRSTTLLKARQEKATTVETLQSILDTRIVFFGQSCFRIVRQSNRSLYRVSYCSSR